VPDHNPATLGSLFSGYGGLDLGVQLALGPMNLRFVSDIEPGPCAILAYHHPDVPNLGDITRIDWGRVERVDVLVGGSPCQDLSTAGQRAGMRPGTKSGLWESMARGIETLHPHFVVWENVHGAFSAGAFSLMESREGHLGVDRPMRALGRVCADLAAIGYDACWTTLSACDIGAPHRRRRVILCAWPHGDTWWLTQVENAGVSLSVAGPVQYPLLHTPRAAMGAATAENLTALLRSGAHWFPTPASMKPLPTPTASRYGSNRSPSAGAALRYGLDRIDRLIPLPPATMFLPTPSVADVTGGHMTRGGKRSGELLLNGIAAGGFPGSRPPFGAYQAAVDRAAWVLGRPAPCAVEPNPGGSQPWRLSARFVEFMMMLPDGHVTDPGIWVGEREYRGTRGRVKQLRALGNGVVPIQAAAGILANAATVARHAGLVLAA